MKKSGHPKKGLPMGLSQEQFSEWISDERRSFDGLRHKSTDFEGWVALKLSCSKAEAIKYLEQYER